MEVKFNGLNFNPDDNSHGVKKKDTKDNKYSHEINYLKGNHPMDVIGRSQVSFSGAKQKITADDVIKYVAENEIVTEEKELKSLKERIAEWENPEAALECAKLFKENPDVDRFIARILISKATPECMGFLRNVFTNERANDIIMEHCNDLMNKLYLVNEDTESFFTELYCNPDISGYFAKSIVGTISRPFGIMCGYEEEIPNAIAKGKMFEKIKKAEGGRFTFENDPNIEKKKALLSVINHNNADFMLKLAGDNCKLNLEEREIWAFTRLCGNITAENAELAELLCNDDSIEKSAVESIIGDGSYNRIDKEDMDAKKSVYLELKDKEDFDKGLLPKILANTTKKNAETIKRACTNNALLEKGITNYLHILNPENLDFITELSTGEEYQNVESDPRELELIIKSMKTGGSSFTKKLMKEGIIPFKKISNTISISPMIEKDRHIAVYNAKDRFYQKFKNNEEIDKEDLAEILEYINDLNIDFAEELMEIEGLSAYDIKYKLSPASGDPVIEKRIIETKTKLLKEALENEEDRRDIDFLSSIDETNLGFLNILLSDKSFPHSKLNEAIKASGTKEEREKIYDLRYEMYSKLKKDENLSIEDIASIVSKITTDNNDFALSLLVDENFPTKLISIPLTFYGYRNIQEAFNARKEIYETLKNDDSISKEDLANLLGVIDSVNKNFAKEYIEDKTFPNKNIARILHGADFEELTAKSNFFNKFKTNDEETNKILAKIISSIEPENSELAEVLYTSESFPKTSIADAIELHVGKSERKETADIRKEIFEKYKDDSNVDKAKLVITLKSIKPINKDFAEMLLCDPIVEPAVCEKALLFGGYGDEKERKAIETRIELHNKYKNAPEDVRIKLAQSYSLIDETNADFAEKLLTLGGNDIIAFASAIQYSGFFTSGIEGLRAREASFEKIKDNEELEPNEKLELLAAINQGNAELAMQLLEDKDFPKKEIANIIAINIFNFSDGDIIAERQEFYNEYKDTDKKILSEILMTLTSENSNFAKELMADKNYPKDKVARSINTILPGMTEILDVKVDLYNKYKDDKNIKKENLAATLSAIEDESQKDDAEKILLKAEKMELTPSAIESMITQTINYKDYKKLVKTIGKKELEEFSMKDLAIACSCIDAYKVQNINELSQTGKKSLLRSIINANIDLFDQSDIIKKNFPLLPKNQEEYCKLLPSLVRSLGIETNTLNEDETKKFEKDVLNLGKELAKVSDNEYAELEITQEYSKEQFTKDVLDKIKGLDKAEKQKVFDYFGFELHKNKINETGYTITGYPQNLNNGAKLAQITDPITKEVVNELRKDVIKFTEDNKINCSNKSIEDALNKVIKVIPELRPLVGRYQAGMNGTKGAHEYDILKHSLKVMQKISSDENFEKLNTSDKKVMMLASLLHDITKKEGFKDPTHPKEGSFDAFYISKKFNLTKDEEIKLYTIIENHEWLGYVNTSKNKDELKERLQSVAYDLRHDNLFDLSLMFTHADLKAIKKDDSFHDKKEGEARIGVDGVVRSFGEAADFYAGNETDTIKSNTIKGYINELKKSQPILPVTKIPDSKRINEAITEINEDGSTNLKGIYKDGELVIIKFNEVDDETWEKIGLKGSTTKGTIAIGREKEDGENIEYEVETGNIKFMCHGLNYPNQLAKFDAFAMPDSDALLSVSYAERPETKFRMFRPQGIILDTDTKYIHGGGKTDAGSGYGKSVNEFKKNYIFGGEREKDRLFISRLIKKATGMTDEEYVKFVKDNENKSLSEIQPKEIQEMLIKAYAGVSSNVRAGKRSYNEMYITNPKPPMAVFAYDIDYSEELGNPVEFLNRETINGYEKNYGDGKPVSVKERTQFLKDYAKEHNIPFIVFGD